MEYVETGFMDLVSACMFRANRWYTYLWHIFTNYTDFGRIFTIVVLLTWFMLSYYHNVKDTLRKSEKQPLPILYYIQWLCSLLLSSVDSIKMPSIPADMIMQRKMKSYQYMIKLCPDILTMFCHFNI